MFMQELLPARRRLPPDVRQRIRDCPVRPAANPSSPRSWPGCETPVRWRSEEHTSELQSLMRISYAVFCLKKKKHLLFLGDVGVDHSPILFHIYISYQLRSDSV